MDIDALKARAAALCPMGSKTGTIVPGRVLYADGDGLAYAFAGNDDTEPAWALSRLKDKLDAAKAAACADRVVILLTSKGSHKGFRFAIASVKPYQGQRSASRRPKNWQFLRDKLENWGPTQSHVVATACAEADDLFAMYGWNDPTQTVILTQDKDMRMVPGWHLDWTTHTMFYLPPGVFKARHGGKDYGDYWFWLQMLQGDAADNIPGLEFYVPEGKKPTLVGPVTAAKLLCEAVDNLSAGRIVFDLYESYYKEDAAVRMLEQACLLYMRPNPLDHFACLKGTGPLAALHYHVAFDDAIRVIGKRAADVQFYEGTDATT